MTELLSSTEMQATPLASFLASAGSGEPSVAVLGDMMPYLGALTPRQLDAPERETGALLFGVAVHDLGWLRRIAVRGEDRYRWLSGMVTNAVETLPEGAEFGSGAYNLVLNAQGRIQGDCYVWRNGAELEIEVTAEQAEALLAHFDRFIIMDDVELVPLESQTALGIAGPNADEILAALRLPSFAKELICFQGVSYTEAGPLEGAISVRLCRHFGTVVPHYVLWVAKEDLPVMWRALIAAGAQPVGAAALETLRIAEGIPAYGIDIHARDLAQETSQMRAISFTKGCYLGQEIVERIRSRGQVHRHLRSLEIFPADPEQLPSPGAELRIAGAAPDAKIAGTLTSVTALQPGGERRILAIGMIRAEVEVGGNPLVISGVQSGTARILNSPPTFTQA